MACYTDDQKDLVKSFPISYGWPYYGGWAVTVISFGTGLISLFHECLPSLNQDPILVSGQQNDQVTYFATASNVNGYQIPHTGSGFTATPVSYGYQTPYVGGDYLGNKVVNGSNLANHVINVSSQTPFAENGEKSNPAITETNNE